MNPDSISNDHNENALIDLLWGLCEGQSTAEDVATLEQVLKSSATARDTYVQFMQMIGNLEWGKASYDQISVKELLGKLQFTSSSVSANDDTAVLSIPASKNVNSITTSATNSGTGIPLPAETHDGLTPESGSPLPGFSFMQNSSKWIFFAFGILLTSLLFSGILFFSLSSNKAPSNSPEIANQPSPSKADSLTVAYLTSSNGCNWTDSSTLFVSEERTVQKGDELNLLEGIAEFRLASGVALSVEGPAGLVLTSPASIVLKYGKVTAQVPQSVKNFKVLAGVCRLEASAAEVGISVIGGQVDAHAFSGKVFASNVILTDELQPNFDDSQLQQRVKPNDLLTKVAIRQGRAITLLNQQEGGVKITKLSRARPNLFATRLSMAGELPISQNYVKAVQDSKPIGYWRFEFNEDSVAQNEIASGFDLNISGEMKFPGKSGNRVAEFNAGADAYLVSRDRLDVLSDSDYSFELWLKPSHIHSAAIISGNAVIPISKVEGHAFLLELENSGRQLVAGTQGIAHPATIRFLHRSPPHTSSAKGTSCFSENPYSVRRWQHVVATKSGEQMQLYIDGKLCAAGVDKTSLVKGLQFFVGRNETTDNIYQFIGQLDELAIYSRALSQEEILNHFKTVDWSGANDNSPQSESVEF